MNNTQHFCNIIRERSIENQQAIYLLSRNRLTGQVIAILRQELDSLVRVTFLLNQTLAERNHLINLTLSGHKWRLRSNTQVTDKMMVDLADTLNGWTLSVYKFGCAFIHLSTFHNYVLDNPFLSLSSDELLSIRTHLNTYHQFPMNEELSINSIEKYLPMVFDKIQSNLTYHVRELQENSL